MTEVLYKIALVLAKKQKPFSDGEEIVEPCLQIFEKYLCDKNIERKVGDIPFSKQSIMRGKEELSLVSEQVKGLEHACTFFSLAFC